MSKKNTIYVKSAEDKPRFPITVTFESSTVVIEHIETLAFFLTIIDENHFDRDGWSAVLTHIHNTGEMITTFVDGIYEDMDKFQKFYSELLEKNKEDK